MPNPPLRPDLADAIAKFLAQGKDHPRAWVKKILDRYAAGDKTVWPIALEMAQKANRTEGDGNA